MPRNALHGDLTDHVPCRKGEKATEHKKENKSIDRNALGEGQFFGTTLNKAALLDNPASIPRPDTSASNRSMGGLRRPKAPYAWGGASSSMVDLSASPAAQFHATQPSGGGGKGLRHAGGSEANMRTRWNNGSSTSLVPPNRAALGGGQTPNGPDGRPGTAGSTRTKAWVNPLDVHFSRDGSFATAQRPSTSSGAHAPPPIGSSGAPQLPKSPLGTFEFNLPTFNGAKKTDTETKGTRREDLTPSPLHQVRSNSPPSPKSYPSPPQSIEELEPPKIRVNTDLRPPSRQRDGSAGQGSREPVVTHQNAEDSLPSPATSVPRSSEEKMWTGPVIQNVRAKRETLMFNGPRRQSFSMDVEGAGGMPKREQQTTPEPTRRPGTAGNGSPPPRSARRPRPPPGDHANVSDDQGPRGPSPPQRFDSNHWRSQQAAGGYGERAGGQSRGPSPFEERENRFQAPRPPMAGSHQLRGASPYRRMAPQAQPDQPENGARPTEDGRPPPQISRAGTWEREPQWQDRGPMQGPPRGRPYQGRPDEMSPPNRPAQGPPQAPRPPPQGQYRIANRPEAAETAYLSPVSNPDTESSWERAALKANPTIHPAIDPNHPSKGPQDFNTRPGFGQSSAKRRPPPPRLSPAPPPLRLRREVDSPALEGPGMPPANQSYVPSNPITSAKFNEPRPAPSPPSTAATSSHMLSSPPAHSQLQPPPPLPESAPSAAPENTRKPPSPTKQAPPALTATPDVTSNPNWPLVDSGPLSANFTVQSPDGASSYGGSKPTSPAGMPLASPAFGTFALGGGGAGPSHWTPGLRAEDPRDRQGGASTPVRPDFGLRAPTGIADEFQVKFI